MGKFKYTRQSYSKFIGIGTEHGGYICEWDPFVVKLKLPRQRGIESIVVWQTSNLIIFLEQKGDKQCFIYDAEQKQIWDIIKIEEEIMELQCMGDYLAIGTNVNVHIYKLPTLKKHTTVTDICAPFVLNADGSVVGKSVKKGTQYIYRGEINTPHENTLVALAVDKMNDLRVVTASEKGTIMRLWEGTKKKWEGRRGIEPANVVSMSVNNDILIVATKKGSIHYFNLNDKEQQGYLWSQHPKSRFVWYCGGNPIVCTNDTSVYIADETGLITIASVESGEVIYQTSLLGDTSSPFTVPL